MSEFSLIEWTEATWNPLLGCSKCSQGCVRCYAIKTAWRLQHNPNPRVAAAYAGLVEKRADGSLNWTGKINLLPDRLREPMTWREPRKVFVNSQSDLFHDDVPSEFIDKVFAVMALCPRHTFQVLTKRAERMRDEVRRLAKNVEPLEKVAREMGYTFRFEHEGKNIGLLPWPIPNIWLGTSVEDQKAADTRISALLDTPAAIRFLSCEPLLGPLDLSVWLERSSAPGPDHTFSDRTGIQGRLHWIIAGGESGEGARAMNQDWVRHLRDQCRRQGTAFFFKQWGMWIPAEWKLSRVDFESDENYRRVSREQAATHAINWEGKVIELSHAPWSQERADTAPIGWHGIRRCSKKAAGRVLDGKEHSEFPIPTTNFTPREI